MSEPGKKLKIGITGATGLMGWHLQVLLHLRGGYIVRLANRDILKDSARLSDFVSGLDAVVHFAGMNCRDDSKVEEINIGLAKDLLDACRRSQCSPQIVFSNSIHHNGDSAYAKGKRGAAELFRCWADKTGAAFCNLILPHTFGEFGRPYSNSVVSTFCHQLALNEKPALIVDRDLELVHALDVARRCLDAIEKGENGEFRVSGETTTVSSLLPRLQKLASSYQEQIVPNLSDKLDLNLFNTLRSYLYPLHYPVSLKVHCDNRGTLFEGVKSNNIGQTFVSTTKPGITRGNHVHTRKLERFLVLSGKAEIKLRKLLSKDIDVFQVDGDHPCYIDMPTFHTHSITNIGSTELMTMFWSNEIFVLSDSDTYVEQV